MPMLSITVASGFLLVGETLHINNALHVSEEWLKESRCFPFVAKPGFFYFNQSAAGLF